jgi:hypothetical protein
MIMRVVESHGLNYRSLMLLREAPNFLFDAQNSAAAVLGNLLQNAQMLQHSDLRRGNLFGCGATVEIADESTDGAKADCIGIAAKVTAASAHFGHKPNAHETTFNAIPFKAQFRGQSRKLRCFMQDTREPLLRITNQQQFREPALLAFQQRRRICMQWTVHGRAEDRSASAERQLGTSTRDSSQCACFHLPPLQIAPQFAWPIFFRAGHQHLSMRVMSAFQKRQQSAASFHVEFAHDVVNQ